MPSLCQVLYEYVYCVRFCQAINTMICIMYCQRFRQVIGIVRMSIVKCFFSGYQHDNMHVYCKRFSHLLAVYVNGHWCVMGHFFGMIILIMLLAWHAYEYVLWNSVRQLAVYAYARRKILLRIFYLSNVKKT